MKCEKCHRSMTCLFITYVCDYCDGLKDEGVSYDRGFVVWRSRPMPAQEYVFPTRDDAERWRGLRGLNGMPIREVLTTTPFRWRKSTGSIKNLEMADHLIEIYADRKYPEGPYKAFLVEE